MRGSESISRAPMAPRKLKPEPGQRSLAGATPRAQLVAPAWPPPLDLSTSDVSILIALPPPFHSQFSFAGADPPLRAAKPMASARRGERMLPGRSRRVVVAPARPASPQPRRTIGNREGDWRRRVGRWPVHPKRVGLLSRIFTSASSMMVNPDTVDLTSDDANEDESPVMKEPAVPNGSRVARKETKIVAAHDVEYREKQRIKREKDERTKKKRQECRQTSIFDAMASQRPPNLRGSADPIPKEVWQRILAHEPGLLAQGHEAGVQDADERGGRRGVPALHQDRAADVDGCGRSTRIASSPHSSSWERKLTRHSCAAAVAAGG